MISEKDLGTLKLLKNVDNTERLALSGVLRERTVPRVGFVILAEEPGPSMFFLLEGQIKIQASSADGKEVILALLDPGDFFGELAILTGASRSADAVALSDSRLAVLSKSDFEQHVLANPGLSRELLLVLAERLQIATRKIADLALYDVYRRIGRALDALAKTNDAGQRVIEKRLTHQDIAALVGTSREMVTRALKGLVEDRCIAIERGKITVFRVPR